MDRIDTGILKIANRIIGAKVEGEHGAAVLAQVAFAREIFIGILLVCGERNGLSGESLLRTLFDVVTSATILAKHPEKLERFTRHAWFTGLRVMRSVSAHPIRRKMEPYIAATEREFKELLREYGNERWHGFGTKASFIEAGFDPSTYDKYYRLASVIAHGQPFVTAGVGKVRPMKAWKARSTSTAILGRLLMLAFFGELLAFVLDTELLLYLNDELEGLGKQLRPIARRHSHMSKSRVDKVLGRF